MAHRVRRTEKHVTTTTAFSPAAERLTESRHLIHQAGELAAEAVALLKTLTACPSCHSRGAPYCTSLRCGCSESCHDHWHTVKGHRR